MIKVFIVDDSALVRKILTTQLSKAENIEVIGAAADPYEARDKIVVNKPDVMILDIEMPKMDGLTFLSKLMKSYPIPVIIVSSLSKKGSDVAIRALELGAVDVMAKPSGSYSVVEMIDELIDKIEAASHVSVLGLQKKLEETRKRLETMPNPVSTTSVFKTTDKIIAIGSSTGGTEAVKDILVDLPSMMPPILITQHMPPNFTKSWADRLDSLSKLHVKEAENGEEVTPGKVLVAPGGYHMVLTRSGARYFVELNEDDRVFHQRPAVDPLFYSVAKIAGKNAIGVILTGMGKDGAAGLKAMRDEGAYTIGQDEKTCVVYGMPRVAFEQGGVCEQLSLNKIAGKLIELVKEDK